MTLDETFEKLRIAIVAEDNRLYRMKHGDAHSIEGFGGALTESGEQALLRLQEARMWARNLVEARAKIP